MVIDLDATLVSAHPEKEKASPTYKRAFGFHPLCAFVDHGPGGTGEPLAVMLRAGNAGANTAADHITIVDQALTQLPGDGGYRVGKKVLIRADSAGGTHDFLEHVHKRRLAYSVGFGLTQNSAAATDTLPAAGWTPAYNADGIEREGAWVAELTGVLNLSAWPDGMRVIVRKERPHPVAQLRFTDRDGLRLHALPPTHPAGSSPNWSCGTAGGPGVKTGFAPQKTAV